MPILPQNRERLLRGGRSTLLRDRLWPPAAGLARTAALDPERSVTMSALGTFTRRRARIPPPHKGAMVRDRECNRNPSLHSF
jgi:hypothetical protein